MSHEPQATASCAPLHLDLKTANASFLIEADVSPKNIFVSDLCTSCRTDLFFSYRREHLTI